MTNQQIIELARSKGYVAKHETVFSGGEWICERAKLSLKNRRINALEVSVELDIPQELCHTTGGTVTIYGSDS